MPRHRHAWSALDAGRGSSLIELLLATVLFLAAVLAATPLFMRAVLDVRTGGARSTAAILAQNALEARRPPATGAPALAAMRLEYYSHATRRWLAGPPAAPDRALWVRETTLRRYPLHAIADGKLEAKEAGAGGDRPRAGPRIDLLSIEVSVSRWLGGPPLARLERLEWATD